MIFCARKTFKWNSSMTSLGLLFLLANTSIESLAASVQYKPPTYPFDRLFTTSAQRRELDNLRAEGKIFSPEQLATETQKTTVNQTPSHTTGSKSNRVSLSGYVQRADGQYMVWIDGHSDLTKGSKSIMPSHGNRSRYFAVANEWKLRNIKAGASMVLR